MPIDLKQIAAIAGMSGLYRIVKPTRTGVIVESLEETPKSVVAQARHRMSLLDEISIYTTTEEGTISLAEAFDRIHSKYGDELPVGAKPENSALVSFMEEIIPDYDEERVYVSDMKKLVSWYAIVNKFVGFTSADEVTEEKAADKAE